MALLATVVVMIMPTVNDPQGRTIANALRESLKFTEVDDVRAGKNIAIRLNLDDMEEAEKRVKDMCDKLLANPVIETYSFKIEPVA
jgi:phosphoribosylformylglycinamidine synthase